MDFLKIIQVEPGGWTNKAESCIIHCGYLEKTETDLQV